MVRALRRALQLVECVRAMQRQLRRAPVATALVLALAGMLTACTANLTRPNCGWGSTIPRHATRICSATYMTLTGLAAAEARGNNRTIHALVANPRVAGRIIRYGRQVRRQGITIFRVTPSLVMNELSRHRVSVSDYLIGRTKHGSITAFELLTVRIHHSKAIVIGDVPNEAW